MKQSKPEIKTLIVTVIGINPGHRFKKDSSVTLSIGAYDLHSKQIGKDRIRKLWLGDIMELFGTEDKNRKSPLEVGK